MRGAETPVVPDKFFAGPVVLNVSRELERFARAFRRGDELNELARFAPKIFFAAPLDVFQSAGGPVSDGSENRGRRGTTIGFPKIDDDGLARRQPLQVVSGNGEAGRLNVFAESEERVMALEIFDRRFVALIDFDLLHARIALDVEDAVAREQVGIEFLGAADVQNGVGFAIELADPGERKAGSGIAGQIARATTPAAPTLGGTLFVTTAPAATTEFSPIVTPLRMTAFMPIQTLSEMMTGAVRISGRGGRSLKNGARACASMIR